MKVLVTSNSYGKYSDEATRLLQEAGFDIALNPFHRQMNEEEFMGQIGDADAIILSTEEVNERVLDAAPNLKMISRYGVGLDNIDLSACKSRNIPVTVTGHANSCAVAEYAISLLLAAIKGIGYSNDFAKRGEWKKFDGMDVTGKTVGIVGLGAIGKEVVRKLQGFDVKILAYDIYYDREFCSRYRVAPTEMEELVRKSDIIMLHAPSNGDKPLIGVSEFENMRQDVVIVNAARASLIDTDAFVEALKSGKVFAAGLDVHDQEPQYDARLMKFGNVVLTPHNAAISREAINATSKAAAQNIVTYFQTGTVENNKAE